MSTPSLAFPEAFEVVPDRGVRIDQRDYAPAGPLPVVDQGSDLIGGYTDQVSAAVQAELPLIVFGDHTRRLKFVDFPFAVGAQGTKLLRPTRALDPKFAYYMLKAIPLEDRGYGRHFALLRKTQIPAPPVDEQRRIVEILEDHLSRLDAATKSVELQFQRLDSLRFSTLAQIRQELVARWDLHPVSSFADTSLGKMLDGKRAAGVPTPYLRNANVRWGRFDLEDVQAVPLNDDERARFALARGDLLVCEGGEPGRCAVWPGSDSLMTFQKALHRVRVTPNRAIPEFVAAMLEEFIRTGRADRLFTGTTIKHLPQEKLRLIEIPLPDPESQSRTAAQVAELSASADRMNSQLHAAVQRSASLRRALLTAAFSGRLTGRPSDLDLAAETAGL